MTEEKIPFLDMFPDAAVYADSCGGLDKAEVSAYSEALLECGVKRRFVSVCPLAFGEVGVKERIKSVLSYN